LDLEKSSESVGCRCAERRSGMSAPPKSSEARSGARVGIVVIGRNEGERLKACLSSLEHGDCPVVYVDSGSTDGSPEHARGVGVDVVELDMSQRFTAGRARNLGFERLRLTFPGLDYVQFVDGDCEVMPGWLGAAEAALDRDPTLAVVCGRRRERHPEASIYNALCDLEWDTPVGEAEGCGGDAMFRVEAFESVGGFNPALVAGEEPDLCVRLRAKGFRVFRLAEEMTRHDANILHFRQWWKRAVRSGHAYAELGVLHAAAEGRLGVRQTLSNLGWGMVVPGMAIVMPFGAGIAGCAYGVLAARIYREQLKIGRTYAQAATYAIGAVVGKFPESVGMTRFWFGVLTGRRSKIIEYKQ
jgi:GT2 family glycosyltransferase